MTLWGSYHPTPSSKSSQIRFWFLTFCRKILKSNLQQKKFSIFIFIQPQNCTSSSLIGINSHSSHITMLFLCPLKKQVKPPTNVYCLNVGILYESISVNLLFFNFALRLIIHMYWLFCIMNTQISQHNLYFSDSNKINQSVKWQSSIRHDSNWQILISGDVALKLVYIQSSCYM